MQILILNGPNINLLGLREPQIYGTDTYFDLVYAIKKHAKTNNIKVTIKQSNHEGALIDEIQNAYFKHYDGIIINAGGYTHTSIAIRDAIASIPTKCIEVHLTDISKREGREHSYLTEVCKATFMGKGISSYLDAIDYLLK